MHGRCSGKCTGGELPFVTKLETDPGEAQRRRQKGLGYGPAVCDDCAGSCRVVGCFPCPPDLCGLQCERAGLGCKGGGCGRNSAR